MLIHATENQFSTSPLGCHPARANEITRNAWDKAASRFRTESALLQMYHMVCLNTTPKAVLASMPNAVSAPIFCMALEAGSRTADRNLVVSGDDGCLLTTGETGDSMDCEVYK